MSEQDFPTWDDYAQWCRDSGDPTFGTDQYGEPVSQEEWENTA